MCDVKIVISRIRFLTLINLSQYLAQDLNSVRNYRLKIRIDFCTQKFDIRRDYLILQLRPPIMMSFLS